MDVPNMDDGEQRPIAEFCTRFPEAFPAGLVNALENSGRRRILRILHSQNQNSTHGSTAADIVAASGLGSLKSVNYHLRVLLRAALISKVSSAVGRTAGGQPKFSYCSTVQGDARIAFLLTATELIDA